MMNLTDEERRSKAIDRCFSAVENCWGLVSITQLFCENKDVLTIDDVLKVLNYYHGTTTSHRRWQDGRREELVNKLRNDIEIGAPLKWCLDAIQYGLNYLQKEDIYEIIRYWHDRQNDKTGSSTKDN